VITHYGWRIEIFSMFPNAVDIDLAAGPDVYPIPWFNIGFFIILALVLVTAWITWRSFVENRWKPFLAELALDDRFENATGGAAQVWRWLRANARERRQRWRDWLDTWKPKDKRGP
jgi:hypothetical protein